MQSFRKKAKNSSISLDPENPMHLQIWSVGNSHLDAAWRWRKQDTREKKVEPTFSRAVFHLESDKFPSFSFVANSAVYYTWIQEDNPLLFQQIQSWAQVGKWEIVGGEWVEADTNIPDGESLIRQRLHGQRFFARIFGKIAEIAWSDDVFGFCHNLPQILRKSGAGSFYTNKLCYSTYSRAIPITSDDYAGSEAFPFFHFRWQAPDGSQILASWAKHKNHFDRHLSHFTLHSRLLPEKPPSGTDPSSTLLFDYSSSWQVIDTSLSADVVPLLLNPYGFGDGGMGPHPLEILQQMQWETMKLVRNGSVHNFFTQLASYFPRLPVWNDELYLETHQGTLTSIGMIKENHHTSEILFHMTEAVSVFAGITGGDHVQEELVSDWENALFLQFHDVLGGTAICEVYRDAASDYNSIFNHLAGCIDHCLMSIVHAMKESVKSDCFSVFNSLGWNRGGFLTMPSRGYFQILGTDFTPLSIQQVAFSPYVINREPHLGSKPVVGTEYLRDQAKYSRDMTELIEMSPYLSSYVKAKESSADSATKYPRNPSSSDFLLTALKPPEDPLIAYESQPKDLILLSFSSRKEIGAFGITNLYGIKSSGNLVPLIRRFTEDSDGITFTNDLFSVRVDRSTGRIIQIGKPDEKGNLLLSMGIGYSLFRDHPKQFDAWNLDPLYSKCPLPVPPIEEIIIEENGPLRYTLIIRHSSTKHGSRIHTRLSFVPDSRMILGESLIDWHERRTFLKLQVDTSLDSSEIICGAPYGIQRRSSHPKTVYQKAMIEFPFQQFVYWQDYSTSQLEWPAIALYSQSKYGVSVIGGRVALSLLKTPQFISADRKYAEIDDDYSDRSKYTDQGFHRIPWAIELFDHHPVNSEVVRHAYEYNTPLLLSPSNAVHQTTSFLSLTPTNVLIMSVKEIEPFLRDAPDWFYHAQMTELAFILRCVEYDGQQSMCTLQLHPSINVKTVQEVDLLERVRQNDIMQSDVTWADHIIKFLIKPFEIKSILVVARKNVIDT